MGRRSYVKLLAAGFSILIIHAPSGGALKAAEDNPIPPVEATDHPTVRPETSSPDPAADRAGVIPSISQLRDAMDQEKDRVEAAGRELSAILEELRSDKSRSETDPTPATPMDGREVLMQERARSEAAVREVATIKGSLQDLADLLKREQETSQSEIRGLQDALEAEKRKAAAEITQLRQALDLAEQRMVTTEGALVAANENLRGLREQNASGEASARTMISDLTEALSQEKRRSEELVRELALSVQAGSTSKGLPEQAPTLALFRYDASGAETSLDYMRTLGLSPAPSSPTGTAAEPLSDQRQETPPEVEFAATAAGSRASGTDPTASSGSLLPEPSPQSGKTPTASVASPVPEQSPARSVSTSQSDGKLVARAEALIQIGDISGARLLLERAARGGHPRAVFLLAETFDPNALSKLGILGLRGDAQRARDGYMRALALGVDGAATRLETLK